MNPIEETKWLKDELVHIKKQLHQARQVALDLADVLSQVMCDGIPEDLVEVFAAWRKEEAKEARRSRKKVRDA